jgi:hypothetical protein
MVLRADLSPEAAAVALERVDEALLALAVVMAANAAALRECGLAAAQWAEAERCKAAGSR